MRRGQFMEKAFRPSGSRRGRPLPEGLNARTPERLNLPYTYSMRERFTIRVAAKVNLYLRVVRRREDGFHAIETVMQSIGLADELAVAPAPELRLRCDAPELPAG